MNTAGFQDNPTTKLVWWRFDYFVGTEAQSQVDLIAATFYSKMAKCFKYVCKFSFICTSFQCCPV